MEQIVISNIFRALNLVSRKERRKNKALSNYTREFLNKVAQNSIRPQNKVKSNERKK
jgi:hypothetical protein